MDTLLNSVRERLLHQYKNSNDISLLTGISGYILFLTYLYNLTKDHSIKKDLEQIIEQVIDHISTQTRENADFSYGGGIAGFYWVINHIYTNNLLFEDSKMLGDIISEEIEDSIIESLESDFKALKYDPLYGYIGKGLYFVSKPESSETTYIISKILQTLDRDKTRIGKDKITWVDLRRKDVDDATENERFVLGDCGLAHGVTGIILFLCALIKKSGYNSLKPTALNLIKPAVAWLLDQEISEDRRKYFMFPFATNLLDVKEGSNNEGRLGWCYGDNVIAYLLYKVSDILQEPSYRIKAKQIVLNSCNIPTKESGVLKNRAQKFDATFCHGAAGIAHIYKKITIYDQSPDILKAAKYWTDLTRKYTQEYLDSRNLFTTPEQKQESFGLLYGYSGIGLHLISDIFPHYQWDKCLMLD